MLSKTSADSRYKTIPSRFHIINLNQKVTAGNIDREFTKLTFPEQFVEIYKQPNANKLVGH